MRELARRFGAETARPTGTARAIPTKPDSTTWSALPTGTTRRASTPGSPRMAATGRAAARRPRHLHRSAATARRALRDAVLRARPRRGHRRAGRRHERHGDRARLLGRRARPHPRFADRCDGAAGRAAGWCATARSSRARPRQPVPDPLRPGLERHRGRRAPHVPGGRRAGAARRHGVPARRGLAIGCFANRYVGVETATVGRPRRATA